MRIGDAMMSMDPPTFLDCDVFPKRNCFVLLTSATRATFEDVRSVDAEGAGATRFTGYWILAIVASICADFFRRERFPHAETARGALILEARETVSVVAVDTFGDETGENLDLLELIWSREKRDGNGERVLLDGARESSVLVEYLLALRII
jgi:hypothetical protein